MADKDGKDTVDIDTSRILSIVSKLQTAYNKSVKANDNFKTYQDAIWNNLDEFSTLGVEDLFTAFDKNLIQPPQDIWSVWKSSRGSNHPINSPNNSLPTVELAGSNPANKINSGSSPSLNMGSATNPTAAAASSSASPAPHSANNTGSGTARSSTPGASPVSTMNTASSATQAATKQAASTDPNDPQGPQNQGAWLRSQLGDISNKLQSNNDTLGDIRIILENMSTSTVKPGGEGTGKPTHSPDSQDEKQGAGGVGGLLGLAERFLPSLILTLGATLIGLLKGPHTSGMEAGMGEMGMQRAREFRSDVRTAATSSLTAQKVSAYHDMENARETSATDAEYQSRLEEISKQYDPNVAVGAQNAQGTAKPYGNFNFGDRARAGFYNLLNKKFGFGIPTVHAEGGTGEFPANAMGGMFNANQGRSNAEYANRLQQQADQVETSDPEAAARYREAARNTLQSNASAPTGRDSIDRMTQWGGRVGRSLQIGGILAGGLAVGSDTVRGVRDMQEGHTDTGLSHFGHAGASAVEWGAGYGLFRGQDFGAALRGGAGLAKIAGRTGALSAVAGAATLGADMFDRHLIENDPTLDYSTRKTKLELNKRGMVDDAAGAVGGAIGGVAGGVIGGAIGQVLIPIPGVGAAIGGVAGAVAGGFLGDKVGRWAGETFQGPTSQQREDSAQRSAQRGLEQVGNLTATAATINIRGQNINTESGHESATRSMINNAAPQQQNQAPSQTHVEVHNHFLQPPTAAEMQRIANQQIKLAESQGRRVTENKIDHPTTGR